MVAITLASHLRVYGVSVPHPPPPQPSNWTRGRTTHSPSACAGPPLAKQMPVRSDDRSQKMLSLPADEHGPAANDRHPWSSGDVLLPGLRRQRQERRQGSAVEGAEPAAVPGDAHVLLPLDSSSRSTVCTHWCGPAWSTNHTDSRGDDRWRQYDPERGDGRRCS
jgi:hypothetical protein